MNKSRNNSIVWSLTQTMSVYWDIYAFTVWADGVNYSLLQVAFCIWEQQGL